MVKRYRNGWWLEQKYHAEGLTQREIAEECGVSPRTIRKQMKRFGIQTRDIEGENHPLYGRDRSEAVREKISQTLQDRDISEATRRRMAEARRGQGLSEETRERIAESLEGLTRPEETRRKMSESTAGELNPMWKGGRGSRYGRGWSAARSAVRERDQVCQECGHEGEEWRLEVHHIVPVWRFREADGVDLASAHELSNLVLLCKRCHVRAEHDEIEFESGIDDPLEGGSTGERENL